MIGAWERRLPRLCISDNRPEGISVSISIPPLCPRLPWPGCTQQHVTWVPPGSAWPSPPLPQCHCYNQAINTGRWERERDVERKYFNRFAAKIYTILRERESPLRHGQIYLTLRAQQWNLSPYIEVRSTYSCQNGKKKHEWKLLSRERRNEGSLVLDWLSDYWFVHFSLSLFPNVRDCEAAKYLHVDAMMEERLTISLRPNPHLEQEAFLAIFKVSSNWKPFLCSCFSSWRILCVCCAHFIVCCSFDFDLFRSS